MQALAILLSNLNVDIIFAFLSKKSQFLLKVKNRRRIIYLAPKSNCRMSAKHLPYAKIWKQAHNKNVKQQNYIVDNKVL